MASAPPDLPVTVSHKRILAVDITEFVLVPAAGVKLPDFTAGAHIDVALGDGLVRSYTLCGPPGETTHYTIAVQHEAAGRGGSRQLHQIEPSGALTISPPANNFPLDEASLLPPRLIAGGIGITPIIAMIHRLESLGRSYSMIYLSRSPRHTAYSDFLESPDRLGTIRMHHDGGDTAKMLPIDEIVGPRADAGHLYCCGPEALMKAVRSATRDRDVGTVHFESFAPATVADNAFDFSVEIASTGQVVGVAADQTILDALRAAGLDLDSSCEAGTCGTCQTRYLEGDVAHEDYVLLDDERETQMMICVSRAVSKQLKLDL
jgi:phthalate 4,5-dioxygenase reductase subunit